MTQIGADQPHSGYVARVYTFRGRVDILDENEHERSVKPAEHRRLGSTFNNQEKSMSRNVYRAARRDAQEGRDHRKYGWALDQQNYDDEYAAEVQRILLRASTPAENSDAVDAARFRALMGCGYVRVVGYARGGPEGSDGDIRHIGFEFTTGDLKSDLVTRISGESRKTLLEFVDAIRAKSEEQEPA